ncbi:MAG: hypothetical protein ABSA01_12440 [Anaerolineales bacterium]
MFKKMQVFGSIVILLAIVLTACGTAATPTAATATQAPPAPTAITKRINSSL